MVTVTALIMAGGKGTRMKGNVEKPLIPFMGKPMILHLIDVVRGSELIDDILVAVSSNTPQTRQRIEEMGMRKVETSGTNYIADMQSAIKKENLKKTLILSADLPLLNTPLLNQIIRYYEAMGKPALSVMAPLESYRRLKLEKVMRIVINGQTYIPVGINFIDGAFIHDPEIEEETLIMKDIRVILNVNSPQELKIAERYYQAMSKEQ